MHRNTPLKSPTHVIKAQWGILNVNGEATMNLVVDICLSVYRSGNRSGGELSYELMAGRLGKRILRAGKSQSILFTKEIFYICI